MDKKITNVPFNTNHLSLLFYSYLSEILHLLISINHFTKRRLLSVLRLTVMNRCSPFTHNLASKVYILPRVIKRPSTFEQYCTQELLTVATKSISILFLLLCLS